MVDDDTGRMTPMIYKTDKQPAPKPAPKPKKPKRVKPAIAPPDPVKDAPNGG
jgi:hypothetical protein